MSKPAEGGAEHAWRAQWLAVKLIDPCREVARVHGYCLAEHGSKRRDIDWVAIPWVDDPASPRTLAEAIVEKIKAVNQDMAYCRAFSEPPPAVQEDRWERIRNGSAGDKPHGRLGWTIHLGGGPYIDLSVMPPRIS